MASSDKDRIGIVLQDVMRPHLQNAAELQPGTVALVSRAAGCPAAVPGEAIGDDHQLVGAAPDI